MPHIIFRQTIDGIPVSLELTGTATYKINSSPLQAVVFQADVTVLICDDVQYVISPAVYAEMLKLKADSEERI